MNGAFAEGVAIVGLVQDRCGNQRESVVATSESAHAAVAVDSHNVSAAAAAAAVVVVAVV
jgi:hypothetical protein